MLKKLEDIFTLKFLEINIKVKLQILEDIFPLKFLEINIKVKLQILKENVGRKQSKLFIFLQENVH